MPQPTLQIHVTNDPMYMENGYTAYLRDGGPCWIIDPGLPPQAGQIIAHVRSHKLVPEKLILTHAHADHIAGVDEVRAALGNLPVYLARDEWPGLSNPMANLSGLFGAGFATSCTDPRDLAPGDELELDGTKWLVLDVAGHSPAGRALYCAALSCAFVGDALFMDSVGRVDFPGSSGTRLIANIREHLMTLPDDTRVLSGHGPATTIGRERRSNPYVLGGLEDE